MRWRSGWWPSSSAIAPTALKNPMAAAQFFATHSRPVVPRHAVRTARPMVRGLLRGVRTAAHQLPCASGTYAKQETGTRSPYVKYGGPRTYVSAQRTTDHRFVARESPSRDGREPIMERLRRAETRLRLVAVVMHSFELGWAEWIAHWQRQQRGVLAAATADLACQQ